jgi:hypothetical protein
MSTEGRTIERTLMIGAAGADMGIVLAFNAVRYVRATPSP